MSSRSVVVPFTRITDCREAFDQDTLLIANTFAAAFSIEGSEYSR